MGATLRVMALIWAELWPIFVLLAVVGVGLWLQARPALRARAAWEGERKLLEAELARASHGDGGLDAMVEVQGRIAAHDVLRPALPRWMFWRR